MKVIIDRFEGDFAVIETEEKKLVNMPKRLLPKDAVEGSVISIEIDKTETDKRRERVSELMDQVWKD